MKHIEPHCYDIANIESMPEEPDGHHEVNLKFFLFPLGNYLYNCTIHMLKYTAIDGSYKRRMSIAGVNSNKSRGVSIG
jgi:hypothetical protein